MAATADELRDLRDQVGRDEYIRACRAACWERGDLRYALHGGQLEAWDLVEDCRARGIRRVVIEIARRWGKSKFGVVRAATTCLNATEGPRAARVPYAAMTATSVAEFIEPHLIELAEDAPAHLKPYEKGGEWHFPSTGARLPMKGCEDRKKANRLRGPEAEEFTIDEAGFIDDLDYVVKSVAMPQLLTTNGMMIVMSSPSESPDHEFTHLCEEAEARGAYMHRDIYDAPHLTAEQIETFKEEVGGEESTAWQREALAKRVVDETRAVVAEFTAFADSLIGTIDRPEHFDAYIVGDIGWSDMTVVLFGYYHFELALLVVEDELVLQRKTSDVLERSSRAKAEKLWPGKRPLVKAIEGAATTVGDIERQEKRARLEAERGARGEDPPTEEEIDAAVEDAASRDLGDRWRQIAFVDYAAAVNALRMRCKRRKVLIHPRCTTTIAHAKHGIWNRNKTSFQRVKRGNQEHHFDGLAALVLLNHKVNVQRDPTPAVVIPYTAGVRVMRPPPNERHARLARSFNPRRKRL